MIQVLIAAIGCGGDVKIVKSQYVPDDTMIVSERTWLRLKEAFPDARQEVKESQATDA
jgi:hypothetical protein